MLDEPTNHLDFPAVVWLEKYLIDYESTLIIVSHDRSFLDNVVDTIVELEDNELNYFKGSFGDYQSKKAEAHRRQEKLYKDYKEKRAHIQEFIDKFRSNPKRVTILRAKAVSKRKTSLEIIISTFDWNEILLKQNHMSSMRL